MVRWKRKLRSATGRLLALPAALLPTRLMQEAAVQMIVRRARRLPPREALCMMFEIDSNLYEEQGHQAVRYGAGTHTKHRHMRYHDFFVQRVGSGQRVLDLGCGIGAVAFDVAQRTDAQVVGIDLSERNLVQARQQYAHPRVDYRHGDVLRDLPDERFDVIILSNVLEHLPRRPQFLRQVVDKTGAQRLLIRVPLFERDWRVPLKQELGVEWRLDEDHETEYLLDQFYQEMSDAGLTVRHLEVHWGEIWAEVTDGTTRN